MGTPSLFLTGFVGLPLFPDIVLVMLYSLFMFRCPAALSASVARVLKNSFLSFLAFFLTSLLSCQYLEVQTAHALPGLLITSVAISSPEPGSRARRTRLHLLISTFKHFLCVIKYHVSAGRHCFWLLFLLPRTSSQDSFQVCFSAIPASSPGVAPCLSAVRVGLWDCCRRLLTITPRAPCFPARKISRSQRRLGTRQLLFSDCLGPPPQIQGLNTCSLLCN